MKKTIKILASVVSLTLAAGTVYAKVSADEAAKLKGELTPMGATKKGNNEGTIPEWSGGMATPPAGYKAGGPRIDPFTDEKPVLVINASNFKDHVDKLTEGQKALLEKYPDSYEMQVYPTHRTAALPEWQYQTTFDNATTGPIEPQLYPNGNIRQLLTMPPPGNSLMMEMV